MQFLEQMRFGPQLGQNVMENFQMLPRDVQMAVTLAMQMWNAVAPRKRSISELSASEIDSITSQHLQRDRIPNLPKVIVRTGPRTYDIYVANTRYTADLDRNVEFHASVMSGLEFAASLRGEPFRDVTTPQNSADQAILNSEMLRSIVFLQPAGSYLSYLPRRL
jgi:hypothetical protein